MIPGTTIPSVSEILRIFETSLTLFVKVTNAEKKTSKNTTTEWNNYFSQSSVNYRDFRSTDTIFTTKKEYREWFHCSHKRRTSFRFFFDFKKNTTFYFLSISCKKSNVDYTWRVIFSFALFKIYSRMLCSTCTMHMTITSNQYIFLSKCVCVCVLYRNPNKCIHIGSHESFSSFFFNQSKDLQKKLEFWLMNCLSSK